MRSDAAPPDRHEVEGDPRGWLRAPAFDLTLIVGVLALALALGGAALLHPAAFGAILLVDLWLLAYPHVASTYTRLVMTPEDRRRRWHLVAVLPLVVAATAGLAHVGGEVALFTLYYVWQTWHYTRQSHGIARAYRRAAGRPAADPLAEALVYAFPLWGVLHRAHEAPPFFFGAPVWWPPVPALVVYLAGAAALVVLTTWLFRQVRSARRHLEPAALFVLSHVAVTAVSYLLVDEVTRGWLFINIWHNAQYLLFVWAANARRFARAPADDPRLLARWSREGRALTYAALCLGLGVAFYLGLGELLALAPPSALPLVLVVHLGINFHHYLVDAVIWRSPAPAPAT